MVPTLMAAAGVPDWQEPFVTLRRPKIFNLRTDPFESADSESMNYDSWWAARVYLLVPALEYVGGFLGTFKEFPPSQKVGSMNLDAVMESLTTGAK